MPCFICCLVYVTERVVQHFQNSVCPQIALNILSEPSCGRGLDEGPLPPTSYGIDMRDWGGIPTEDDKSRVRAVGVRDPGEPRVCAPSDFCYEFYGVQWYLLSTFRGWWAKMVGCCLHA